MTKKPDLTSDDRAPPEPKRVMPRVSTASGGLMQGMNPDNIAGSIQEIEDLEYIERLMSGFK